MNISHTDTSVLLIGRALRQIDRMIETLTMVGAELHFADDAEQGLELMTLERPDLVICHVDLPDADSDALCRAVRGSQHLSRIPLIFAGESHLGIDRVYRTLHAGADDFVSQDFNSDAFLAKLVWLMHQRSDETARRREFEALRRDQIRTLDIVRETTAIFRSLDHDELPIGPGSADERIEVGLGMLAGLANILEEQMTAVDGWFTAMDSRRAPSLGFTGRPPHFSIPEMSEMSLAA